MTFIVKRRNKFMVKQANVAGSMAQIMAILAMDQSEFKYLRCAHFVGFSINHKLFYYNYDL